MPPIASPQGRSPVRQDMTFAQRLRDRPADPFVACHARMIGVTVRSQPNVICIELRPGRSETGAPPLLPRSTPPLKQMGSGFWLLLQAPKGDVRFTASAERAEYGNKDVLLHRVLLAFQAVLPPHSHPAFGRAGQPYGNECRACAQVDPGAARQPAAVSVPPHLGLTRGRRTSHR